MHEHPETAVSRPIVTRIVSRTRQVPGELEAYVRKRVGFALDRLRAHIQHLEVRLSDENGTHGPGRRQRGGIDRGDKVCRMAMKLPGLPPLTISAHGEDWFGAVDQAAHRLALLGQRRLARARQLLRRAEPVEPLTAPAL